MKTKIKVVSLILALLTLFIPLVSCNRTPDPVDNSKDVIANDSKNPTSDISYKIVPATEEELAGIADQLYPLMVQFPKGSYDYISDNIYDSLFDFNGLNYVYPMYNNEVKKYICEPLRIENNMDFWSDFVFENDPLGKFNKIPEKAYDSNGKVTREGLIDYANSQEDYDEEGDPHVGGYVKYSGKYIDWLVEGVWNGKVDHNTFFDFKNNNFCYYSDGFYYTPYLIKSLGGGIFYGPVIDEINELSDNKYEVKYHILDSSDIPTSLGKIVIAMKESSNGFRFWSIFKLEIDSDYKVSMYS